ncbi:phosphatidylinositol mannoside acyltransferase [Corynebacterium sp. zg-331]|uniref:phosphatidylinositol mannoside acyltransferase n=1 Tax=unclassified Corynebacterium TaxID=2624378 RepID=UPI00128CCF83|nr:MULTISPECIES: phosphatidylinositol mannoside acyltransferase [unclassified Corynebacterium]MBC3185439.1 phosphatidylinositol mannoside acyltransferase [Corynebacterium sp. zg-331]MPV51934.1 phosphatidylinositol mannoside acyltransferase [Corynebacterium sp. zg331]
MDLSTMGYLAGWRAVRLLPEPWARWLFERGADIASDRGRGMEQLRRNLARVVGPENVTRDLVREATRSYARYWLEAFRLPTQARDGALGERLARFVCGAEHLAASAAKGRGVVLVLPHSGNWDMAGVYAVHACGSVVSVAERLRPEALFDAFVEYRESLGFDIFPLSGGTPPFPHLKEALGLGKVVCLLGERDIKRRGVEVEFFGETTTMPVGAVELCRQTGAPLHVVHCWFEGADSWGFSVSEEIEVGEVGPTMQRVADLFAAHIAAHPQDWHMLQPLWPSDVALREERRARHAGRRG